MVISNPRWQLGPRGMLSSIRRPRELYLFKFVYRSTVSVTVPNYQYGSCQADQVNGRSVPSRQHMSPPKTTFSALLSAATACSGTSRLGRSSCAIAMRIAGFYGRRIGGDVGLQVAPARRRVGGLPATDVLQRELAQLQQMFHGKLDTDIELTERGNVVKNFRVEPVRYQEAKECWVACYWKNAKQPYGVFFYKSIKRYFHEVL